MMDNENVSCSCCHEIIETAEELCINCHASLCDMCFDSNDGFCEECREEIDEDE
jgi:hypothetical protein